MTPPGHPSDAVGPLATAATVTGLVSVAVVQPVLEVVARGPEFLVAHRLHRWDIVAMVAALITLALMAGAAAGIIVRWLPPRGRLAAAATMVGILLGVVALQVAIRLTGIPDWAMAGGAVAAGVAGALAYRAWEAVQLMGRYLGAAPLVVAGLFLVGLPGSLWVNDPAHPVLDGQPAPTPVVIVIFDELPAASLIDGQGRLLVDQYPSFARLASDGVWYRNAVTVQTRTTEAIPAILSGSLVTDGLLPNPVDHPHTILTLLADSHDVATLEPVTDLCPAPLCLAAPETSETALLRWRRLATDLVVIHGHLSVPPGVADRLPPIDHAWAGFTGAMTPDPEDDHDDFDLVARVAASVEGDRRRDVDQFLDLLDRESSRPPLRVAHFMLPHRPWDHLPDGRLHLDQGMSGHEGRGWGADPYLMATGWRRHLLQVGYADTIVGAVIDRLVDAGRYDATLLVVVADHGVTFAPGVADMRVTNADSIGSILPVPLFVKYPQGTAAAPPAGTITDVRAETTDIVPTILDVLGVEPAGPVDGASLLGPVPAGRANTQLVIRDELLVISGEGTEKLEVAAGKLEWFPGGDPWRLVPVPEARALLGRSADTIVVSPGGLVVELAPPPDQGAVVNGTVTGVPPPIGRELVALAVDGVIVGVTRVMTPEGGQAPFFFLVDPDLLADAGRLEALVVGLAGP